MRAFMDMYEVEAFSVGSALLDSVRERFKAGTRVIVQADGVTYYGTVERDIADETAYIPSSGTFKGQVMVSAYWSSIGFVSAMPFEALQIVCGECADCRALNLRPGCAA